MGTPITSDNQTIMGILISIIANQNAVQENDLQSLYSNLDINAAEGVYLDRLVAYIGLSLAPASAATGQLKVWRNTIGVISSAVLFQTAAGERFTCPNGLTHQLTSCAELLLTPATPATGTVYTVVLNSVTSTYTATAGNTVTDVVNGLVTAINASN